MIQNLKIANFKIYFLIILISFGTQIYFVDLFKLFDLRYVSLGGDLSYELVPLKVAFDGNLLGFTTNLMWPYGYSTWAYPTMGVGTTLLAWLIGILNIKVSIFFVYFFIAIFGNTLNATLLFWALKDEFKNRIYPFSISLFIGISSLIFYRFGHMPVIWFYIFIVTLGIWFKFRNKSISYFKIFIIIFLAGVFSPFWWNLIIIFQAITLIFIYLVNFKNNFENLKFWGLILVGVLLSYLPILGLYLRHSDLNGPTGRNPWQSNVFGGRLTDILVGSPFLNQKLNLIEKLNEAISPEARITQFGFTFIIGVVICLIYLASSLINKFVYLPKDLNLITFVLFLFFILGGLGNLQASLLFLVHQSSPARSWSRLIIFISIIGLFILFKFLENYQISLKITLPIIFVLFLFSILDLNFSKKPEIVEIQQIEEYKAVNFIREFTNNCPILQLPLDTYPIPQDFLFENGGKFVYNEFIPYLISEQNQWSIGGTPFNKYWVKDISIPRIIDSNYIDILKKQGFCGIIFDKDYSTWQIGRNAGINTKTGELTNDGNWPGVRVEKSQPDYQDQRFLVYLIN